MGILKKIKDAIDKVELDNEIFEAFFQLDGANCSSCVYAIEKISLKFDGISYCNVNVTSQEICIHYDGRTATETKISELVRQLGYSATFKEKRLRTLEENPNQ